MFDAVVVGAAVVVVVCWLTPNQPQLLLVVFVVFCLLFLSVAYCLFGVVGFFLSAGSKDSQQTKVDYSQTTPQ